jgi:hypothetical protein
MRLTLAERKWDWIEGGLLTYALAAMRALWFWLLLHMFSQSVLPGQADLLAPLVVLGLLAGGTLASQVGVYRIKSPRAATVLVVLTGLVALLLALYLRIGAGRWAFWQPSWLAAAARTPALALAVLLPAVWLWRWGILTGREPPGYDTYAGNFVLGLCALALAIGIVYASHIVPMQGVLLTLLLFFAIGLATMAIASVQDTRRFERQQSAQSLALNRYWLGTVGVVIGVLVIAGMLLAQIFAPDAITRLLGLLGLLLQGLTWLLLWVVLILAYVVFGIFGLLAKVFKIQRHTIDLPNITVTDFSQQFKELQNQPAGVSPTVYLVLRIVAGALLLAVIVVLFALALRRFRTYMEDDVEATRESILSASLLREQLARLFRRRGGAKTRPAPFVPVTGDDPAAQVRRTYQSLLAWAEAHGLPRQPGFTPAEYARVLVDRLQAPAGPVNVLTEAYLQARYGRTEVVTALARDAADAWATIQTGEPQP